MSSNYLAIFLCFLVIYIVLLRKRGIYTNIIKRKRMKWGKRYMNEMVNRYLGKECIVYTIDSQLNGIIEEVKENWLVLRTNDVDEIVNLDFVKRIREYPLNKSGKKKSVILD